MVETRQYLMVWQLGDNDQSMTMTGVAAKVSKMNTPEQNIDNILTALQEKTGANIDDVLVISMSTII